MATVHVHEDKNHSSKLIQRALAGEEIIVTRGKTPSVRLPPLPDTTTKGILGTQKDFIQSISPDFDKPLEEFEPFFQ